MTSTLKIQEIADDSFTLAWLDPDDGWGGEFGDHWAKTADAQAKIINKLTLTEEDTADLECAVVYDAVQVACPSDRVRNKVLLWDTRKGAQLALKAAKAALKDLKFRLKTRTPPDAPWMVQARAAGWGPLKKS
jgi:hypothetical protein